MGSVGVLLAAGHAWAGAFRAPCAPCVALGAIFPFLSPPPRPQPDASRRGSYRKLSSGGFNRVEHSAVNPVVCAFKIQKFEETRAFVLRTCILLQKSESVVSGAAGSELCPAVSLSSLGAATPTAQEQRAWGENGADTEACFSDHAFWSNNCVYICVQLIELWVAQCRVPVPT